MLLLFCLHFSMSSVWEGGSLLTFSFSMLILYCSFCMVGGVEGLRREGDPGRFSFVPLMVGRGCAWKVKLGLPALGQVTCSRVCSCLLLTFCIGHASLFCWRTWVLMLMAVHVIRPGKALPLLLLAAARERKGKTCLLLHA